MEKKVHIKSFLLGCLGAVALSLAIMNPVSAADAGFYDGPTIIDQSAIDQVQFDSIAGVLVESDDFNWGAEAEASRILVAIDNTISALCDGSDSAYNRPGGFCDAVAVNKSMVSGPGSGDGCPQL